MADYTPNQICGVNAIPETKHPCKTHKNPIDVPGDVWTINWGVRTESMPYSFPAVTPGMMIQDTDVLDSLINVVNYEIGSYKLYPRHDENGGTIYYAGGSELSTGINRDQSPITYNIWFDLVSRVIALENAWGLSTNSLDISSVNKNDGVDLVESNYINSIANALNTIRGMNNCGTVCKCNVVCTCNGNCGCNYSDERLKQDIESIDPRLIDYLTPIKFKYTNELGEQNDGKYHYGIRAQNLIGNEMEESGLLNRAEYGRLKVNYLELIGILIAEAQELRKENNELKTRLKTIEESLSRIDRTFRNLDSFKA